MSGEQQSSAEKSNKSHVQLTTVYVLFICIWQLWNLLADGIFSMQAIPLLGIWVCVLVASVWFFAYRNSEKSQLSYTGIAVGLYVSLLGASLRGNAFSPIARWYFWLSLITGTIYISYYIYRQKRVLISALAVAALISSGPYQVERVDGFTCYLQVVFLAFFIVLQRSDSGDKQPALQKMMIYATPFLVLAFVSSLSGIYLYASIKSFTQIIIGALFGYCVLVALKQQENLTPLLTVMACTGMGLAASGVVRLLYRCSILGMTEGIRFRVWPMDTPPNYAVFHFMLLIPFTLLLLPQLVSKRLKWLPYGISIIMATYIIISYARIAWAVLFVEMFMVCAVLIGSGWLKKLPAIRVLFTLLVIIAVVILFAPRSFKQRIREGFDLSREPRFQVWRDVMDIVQDYPVLGSGLSTKKYLMPFYQGRNRPLEPVTGQYMLDAHSTYMEIVSALGIPALCAYLWLLFGMFRGSLRTSNMGRIGTAAAIAALIALVSDGFVNFRLLLPDNAYIFWFLVAFTVGQIQMKSGKPHLLRVFGHLSIVLLSLLFLWYHLDIAHKIILQKGISQIEQISRESGKNAVPRNALNNMLVAHLLMPFDAHASFLIGAWHQHYGARETAQTWFRKAIASNPYNPLYFDTLGTDLLEAGQLQEAESALLRANELFPFFSNGTYHFHLALLFLRSNRIEEALDELIKALIISPEKLMEYVKPFAAYSSTPWEIVIPSRLEFMAFECKEELPERSYMLYLKAAKCYEKAQLYTKALQVYLSMDAYFGKSVQLDITKSRLFLKMGDMKRGYAFALTAHHRSREDSIVMNEIGLRLFQMKRYDEAALFFNRAIANWPSIIFDNHLAHQYLKQIADMTHDAVMSSIQRKKLIYLQKQRSHQIWEFTMHFADLFGEIEQFQLYAINDEKLIQ